MLQWFVTKEMMSWWNGCTNPFHVRPRNEDKRHNKMQNRVQEVWVRRPPSDISVDGCPLFQMACDLSTVVRLTEKSPGSGYSHRGLFKWNCWWGEKLCDLSRWKTGADCWPVGKWCEGWTILGCTRTRTHPHTHRVPPTINGIQQKSENNDNEQLGHRGMEWIKQQTSNEDAAALVIFT